VETGRALRPRMDAWARRATRYRRATGRFPEGWPPAERSGRPTHLISTCITRSRPMRRFVAGHHLPKRIALP
ncbi:hypothetical protein DB772_17095, partial [Xanthomonas perforans]